ncbi:hypothetical protein V2O64_04100 [Verrucomicrobiaceae bacterium 227]
MESHFSLIQKLTRPLEPIPTGLKPVLPRLEGIRCLAFDIYGTLLISERQCPRSAMATLIKAHRLPASKASLDELISRHHAKAHSEGIEHPEVEIREIWSELYPGHDAEKLALHYELLSHHVWPMPGLQLPDDLLIAVVSNAQFYTPQILETIRPLPVDPDLAFYSYHHLQAKPGLYLFEKLKKALSRRNISPSEVLFLGNDHEKDILPAKKTGFQTALFAGDTRSLSFQSGDMAPDSIITHLSQLSSLLGVSSLTN